MPVCLFARPEPFHPAVCLTVFTCHLREPFVVVETTYYHGHENDPPIACFFALEKVPGELVAELSQQASRFFATDFDPGFDRRV